MKNCSLCGKEYSEFGNNPEPIKPFSAGECCDLCNSTKVIPARLKQYYRGVSE